MLRKWLRKAKIQWNEQTKLFAAVGLCVAMLAVAALLPLAFRSLPENGASEEEAEGNTALELKSALFVDFWNGGGEDVGIEKIEHPGTKTVAFCRETMDGLAAEYIDDRGLNALTPTGSEYTLVSRGRTELHLCRMWLQARGDWQNWMDVCFDSETGELYYFYVSRECLTNGSLYDIKKPSVRETADWLAERWNCTVRYVQPDAGGKGTAILNAGSGTIGFEISCISYDALVDIRISCV